MPKRNKIKAIEQAQGRPIKVILAELYGANGGDQTKIGAALGISQSTVSLWLMRTGLRAKKVLDNVDTVTVKVGAK